MKVVLDLKKSLKSVGLKKMDRMPKPTEAQAHIILEAGRKLLEGSFDPAPQQEMGIGILCDQLSDWSWELCRQSKIQAAHAMQADGDYSALAATAQLWDDACEAAWRVKDWIRGRKAERQSAHDNPLAIMKSTDSGVTHAGKVTPAWMRVPGAASMLRGDKERRYAEKLYTDMPADKPLISDGNFNTADDVVKGLGMPTADQSLWSSKIGRLVGAARIETDIRKSIYATIRDEGGELPKYVKGELARRTLALYREARRQRGDFLAKGFQPPKGMHSSQKPQGARGAQQQGPGGQRPQQKKPAPGQQGEERVSVAPPGKDVPGFEDAANGGTPDQRKQQHFTDPAVDVGGLDEGPSDPGVITMEIEKMHKQLHQLHAHMDGSPAQIHLHNDLVAKMREVYAKPDPDGLREIKHLLHHFAEIVQGPEEPEPTPDMNDVDGGMGPPPGKGGPPGKGPPGAGGGKPPAGKKPGGPPMMQKSGPTLVISLDGHARPFR